MATAPHRCGLQPGFRPPVAGVLGQTTKLRKQLDEVNEGEE
jgi:hypothetical protein